MHVKGKGLFASARLVPAPVTDPGQRRLPGNAASVAM